MNRAPILDTTFFAKVLKFFKNAINESILSIASLPNDFNIAYIGSKTLGVITAPTIP